MDQRTDAMLLERLACPAFIVEDGVITQANQKAVALQFEIGNDISKQIQQNASIYQSFASGQLYLTLAVANTELCTCVTRNDTYDLFCIETEYNDEQLRAFALVAQILRDPLSGALNANSALAELKNIQNSEQFNALSKNLHRILRTVCNLSDAASINTPRTAKTQNCVADAVVTRVINNAASALRTSGFQIEYTGPKNSISCAMDSEKIERALLNMISNATKFGDTHDPIQVQLYRANARCNISVTNACANATALLEKGLVSRFEREPGIENRKTGVGLGMTIVRNVAIAHDGTVLVDAPDMQHLRVTMSIPIKRKQNTVLRSPLMFETDYAGGYDRTLLELSDVLDPAEY